MPRKKSLTAVITADGRRVRGKSKTTLERERLKLEESLKDAAANASKSLEEPPASSLIQPSDDAVTDTPCTPSVNAALELSLPLKPAISNASDSPQPLELVIDPKRPKRQPLVSLILPSSRAAANSLETPVVPPENDLTHLRQSAQMPPVKPSVGRQKRQSSPPATVRRPSWMCGARSS